MEKKDLKIVFLGTPEFAVASLESVLREGYSVKAVVTMPDKQAGRGHKFLFSDVKKCALEHGLPVLQPRNLKDPEFLSELASYGADLFIVIAFRMLPEAVWGMPRLGTFNLHASLLPRYRGAAPINRAVMNGEKETGVTTFFLKHEIDTGDIIASRKIGIGDDENVGSVHDRLMALGAEMVLDTLQEILKTDGNVAVTPQPEGEFTPAPKIFAEDCVIDWNRPREEVRNQIRGLSPYPAARTSIRNAEGKEFSLKVFGAKYAEAGSDGAAPEPGALSFDKKHLYVMCGDGPLEITELQLQGKKPMSTTAFLAGFRPLENQVIKKLS